MHAIRRPPVRQQFSRTLPVSFLLPFLVPCLLFQISTAQEMTGTLRGRLVDTLGVPVANAHVHVTGSHIQGGLGNASDEDGYFTLLAVPLGEVTVRISHASYRPLAVKNITIELGKTTYLGRLVLHFQIRELPEIVVSTSATQIDPTTTTYTPNLRSEQFENLPVDRNYRSMTSLLPQANLSYYGDEVNIGGATGFENKYFVDGIDVTDPLIGASGMNVPYNFVQEVQVKPGGYEAGSPSALGGVVNAVTYSGTNELHGSVFGFYRSNQLTKYQRVGLLDPTQGDFSNYDIGFNLSGPVIRDRLWFFVAYNPTFARRDVNVPEFGVSVDRTVVHSFSTKFTWSPSQQLRFALSMNGDPTRRKAVGRGILVPPANLANPDPYLQDIREGGVNLSMRGTYNVGNDLLIDASIARVNRHDTGDPSTERGAKDPFFGDNLTNTWSGGVSSRWDSYRHATISNLKGTLRIGAHTVQAGAGYKVTGVNNRYFYDSIIKYDTTFFERYTGRGFQEVQNRLPSVFLHDTWQLFRTLRIHAGLRWDGQYMIGSDGKVAQTVNIPLQPRIGFVFLPDDDGSQKIYCSFGRFSQELALFNAVNNFSDQGYGYTIDYNQDPRLSAAGGDTVYTSNNKIHPGVPGLRGQFFDEFSIGYEQVVSGNLRGSMQGVYRTLREAVDDVYLEAENQFRFGNPGRGFLAAWPRPRREYMAFVVTLEQRGAALFNFLVSYTLSRNYGNFGGLFDAVYHSEFPNQSSGFDDLNSATENTTGLLPNDRTHVFKFSGSYSFSFGLVTGISFIAQSGTPLNALANQNIGVRYLVPRGTAGRTPALWDLSARVMYELPFADSWQTRLIFDVFHIASQRQPVDFDQRRYFRAQDGTLYPISTYGQAYRYQPPMSVRLGMEVSF